MNPQNVVNGGRDLSHLKGGDRVAQKAQLLTFMTQQGFVCSCGELITDEGVLALGWRLGRFPNMTPQGVTLVDDAHITTQPFHSRECPAFTDALENGIQTGEPDGARAPIGLVRDIPPTEWVNDPR